VTGLAATRARRADIDWREWLRDNGVYVGIVVLVIVNVILSPSFLSERSLRLQIVQVVPVAIVALGMAVVIGTRGIDISVGSVMAIAAATMAAFLGYGPIPAIIAAILACMVVGLVNGSLVAFVGIQPIVATMGMLVAGRGIALVIANGKLTEIFDPTLTSLGTAAFMGIPVVVLITIALAVVVSFIVGRTTFGRHVLATGGNPVASALSGVPAKRTLLTVYVLSATLAAIAGIIATARVKAADPSFLGNLIELSAITAVVVGCTPLSGGKVRIAGTIAGALLLQLITATLIRNNLSDSTSRMVAALIILAAVYLQRDRGTT
jgi:ribose/xylose/arabinose/galactoside ABC-type transport system permease subunit